MDSLDSTAITTTDFTFLGQTGLYHGKVRDVYAIGDDTIVSVATDRISAFDTILPRPIPYKGQVLNQLAAFFLNGTADIVPNWLQAVPDPNVSVGLKAEPVKIEVVVRGCLVGHAWREYQTGVRVISGATIPDGLSEYDAFSEPIVTPSTKADVGHDEDITPEQIVVKGLATAEEWQELSSLARKLFARGQKMAREQAMVLADTKYEFGRLNGKIILIDEVHTPDSSRYFYADTFDIYAGGDKSVKPKHVSKEFVREWLVAVGFEGKDGQIPPEMTDAFVSLVSDRYIELYEQLAGERFIKAAADPLQRIETNITNYLEGLHATN